MKASKAIPLIWAATYVAKMETNVARSKKVPASPVLTPSNKVNHIRRRPQMEAAFLIICFALINSKKELAKPASLRCNNMLTPWLSFWCLSLQSLIRFKTASKLKRYSYLPYCLVGRLFLPVCIRLIGLWWSLGTSYLLKCSWIYFRIDSFWLSLVPYTKRYINLFFPKKCSEFPGFCYEIRKAKRQALSSLPFA